MKTPTLEEVKEYFKNAKEVRCANRKRDTGTVELNKFKFTFKEDAVVQNPYDKNWIVLWSKLNGYAEIISYKDTYTVSKDFVLEAHESACSTWKTKIENQFPELFPKLEEGKWYKRCGELLVWKGGKETYGFVEGGVFSNEMLFKATKDVIPATKEEVETALIAEAKKRGFKENIDFKLASGYVTQFTEREFKNMFFENGKLFCHSNIYPLFDNGVWFETIGQPIELSLDEIAEKFGVDVSLIKIKK